MGEIALLQPLGDHAGAVPEDPASVPLTCVLCGARWTAPLPAEARTPTLRRMAYKVAQTWTRQCPACVRRQEDDAAELAERTLLVGRLANAGIPVALLGRLDDLAPRQGQSAAFDVARSWASEGGYAFLAGDVGRGKSTLAAAALVDLLDREDGLWVAAPRLLQMANATFGTDEHRAAQRIFASRQALVLDDLGQGTTPASDQVRNQFHAAIDSRIVERVPLLITSNRTPSELARLYGDWLGSRIAGHFTQVHVDGPDHRLN